MLVVQVVDDGAAVDGLVIPHAMSSVHGSENMVIEVVAALVTVLVIVLMAVLVVVLVLMLLVSLVQVVDNGAVVDVLVTPHAISSVHGSENMVIELVVVLLVVLLAVVMAMEEMGYG